MESECYKRQKFCRPIVACSFHWDFYLEINIFPENNIKINKNVYFINLKLKNLFQIFLNNGGSMAKVKDCLPMNPMVWISVW
jgi:hypothetical protein